MFRPAIIAAVLTLPCAATAQEHVTLALDWTLNTNHVGLIAARDRGLYEDAGIEIEILPFSDTSSTALLAAGVADFAYMTSLGFMSARAGGTDLVALWVTMQHDTGRLVFQSDNPDISRPADLEGKTYAGFGSAWEDALISTMIENDGGNPVYDTVTLGTGAYEALAAGRVDFTLEVATWEGVNSDLLGREQSHFTYANYGIPDQQTGYIGTRTAFLSDNPDLVRSFMTATQAGYEWAADHPDAAADLLIDAGNFSNPELVRASMEMIVDQNFLRDGGRPVGGIDGDRFAAMARFLYDSGVLTEDDGQPLDAPDNFSGWYDQSWMTE